MNKDSKNIKNSKIITDSITETETSDDKCSICHLKIQDSVSMACKGMHSFCFLCIITWIGQQKKLDCCPICRGGDKYIIIKNTEINNKNYLYNTLSHFSLCKPILEKILRETTNENSCLVSERVVLTYIKNEKQLQLLFESKMPLEDLMYIINWEKSARERCYSCNLTSSYRTLVHRPSVISTRTINYNIEEEENDVEENGV